MRFKILAPILAVTLLSVFENDNALEHFFDSDWSGSAQADAAAMAGKTGGAYSGSSCGQDLDVF